MGGIECPLVLSLDMNGLGLLFSFIKVFHGLELPLGYPLVILIIGCMRSSCNVNWVMNDHE